MNKSTIKKIAALSLTATLCSLSLFAQDEPATGTAPKLFEGRNQFRTWSIGLNAGVLAPTVLTGGHNDFSKWEMNLGYGGYIKKQLAPSFSLQADFLRGTLSATSEASPTDAEWTSSTGEYETDLAWQAGLSGTANVGTIDFLRRKNSVDFFVTAGFHFANYTPTVNGTEQGDRTEQVIPVGAGIKFKLGEVVNLDLGYKMHFLNADNVDGTWANHGSFDKYSYGYAGLEFILGNKEKPALEWANPIALMYDELYDETLRQEVEALKGRVSTVEEDLNTLKADEDGDGVSDYFDKEPGSAAGARVDGSGRAMDIDGDGVFDHEDECPTEAGPADNNGCPVEAEIGENTIQFDFDSAEIRPESYGTLDQLAEELSAGSTNVALEGHASAEGTESYNQRLSERRANSVKKYLVNAGVDSGILSTSGYGESRPVASNDTEEGRSQNRRVEIKIQ
ncbi:OOP family OmpA-OmpF porin [Anseongella ginsenosidimutans]|uniref:OOP family OmpA-OmpF porin n=1 Tax=Anseongella ginsenosidimutans TaxID=496056 RepID=A0A4R3KMV0_9SPHI|nr:OmpA family protein [Anseongella ginsenosidimutans]QEC52000.1 OmpA family protein [Anseongella ginsenosidimutans]TCS85702.1 OOP family OmpA-OmpF porin [Anseongella ginsenosidimutans]